MIDNSPTVAALVTARRIVSTPGRWGKFDRPREATTLLQALREAAATTTAPQKAFAEATVAVAQAIHHGPNEGAIPRIIHANDQHATGLADVVRWIDRAIIATSTVRPVFGGPLAGSVWPKAGSSLWTPGGTIDGHTIAPLPGVPPVLQGLDLADRAAALTLDDGTVTIYVAVAALAPDDVYLSRLRDEDAPGFRPLEFWAWAPAVELGLFAPDLAAVEAALGTYTAIGLLMPGRVWAQ